MKIIFICGSLEAGRDGVGDYVRCLACEFIRQGHIATAISINDKYVGESLNEIQSVEGTDISVLRIAASGNLSYRFLRAKKWIDEVDPDWISLQFVPFSFNSKGIPFRFCKQIASLGLYRNWHIMFHELWVGMDKSPPFKHIILGWIQQHLIRYIIRKLEPKYIHTQSRFYQHQLNLIGVNPGYLPLFSNILKGNSHKLTLLKEFKPDFREIKLVLFGSIHPGAPVNLLAFEAFKYSIKNRVEICLVFLGLCGSEQDHWMTIWKSYGLKVKLMGEQPQETISELLSIAYFGLTTTPIALVDKSGSVAAMLEHGLPVMSVSSNWQPKKMKTIDLPIGICEYTEGRFSDLMNRKYKMVRIAKVSEVATELGNVLQN